jgi:hypothetical protein
MAQIARAAGWGSLIWVVNDSPNGYGALTGRPGPRGERAAPRWVFIQGFRPNAQRAWRPPSRT